MALRPETLPRDPDRLIEMVLACEGKIELLQATIVKLKTIIFGARSEKSAVIIAEQLSLGLSDVATDAALRRRPMTTARTTGATTRPVRSSKKRNRNIGALPGHLPTRRCDDRAGNDDVSVLRGRVALHWRGRQRRGRSGSRGASDPAHDPPQIRAVGPARARWFRPRRARA